MADSNPCSSDRTSIKLFCFFFYFAWVIKLIQHWNRFPRWHVSCTQTHKLGTLFKHSLISSITLGQRESRKHARLLSDRWITSLLVLLAEALPVFFSVEYQRACHLRGEIVICTVQTNWCRYYTSHKIAVGEKVVCGKQKSARHFVVFLWQEWLSRRPWMDCCSSRIHSVIRNRW